MKKNISKQFAFGLLTSLAYSLSHAQTAQVAGPVERVSSDAMRITVLGQTFLVDPDTRIFAAGRVTRGSQRPVVEVGSLVSIESESPMPTGRAASIVVAKSQYVPGATPVFVAGTVKEVSTSLGKLRVGELEIDISTQSPEVVSAIRAGSFVEIYGTQPLPNGLLIGQDLRVVVSPALSAESLTDAGTKSMGGTGTQSIGGTGTQSIAGTGKQSIGGTGTQSIGGTGTQSIAGTGTQSISGTGTQSIAGTGAF